MYFYMNFMSSEKMLEESLPSQDVQIAHACTWTCLHEYGL